MTTNHADSLTLPPQDLTAERSVLGGILLDGRGYDDVCEILKPSHFYSDVHGAIYTSIAELLDSGKPADAVTVADRLDAANLLDDVGGVPYLLEILEAVPHSAHTVHYANIVRDKWTKRELSGICTGSLRTIHGDSSASTDEVLEDHERALFRLADQKQSANQEMSIRDILGLTISAMDERIKNPQSVPGLSSGFEGLDLLTSGFHPATLSILAARPSMGKTALICNLADWFMANNKLTLLFSLEQSKLELAERFLSIRSRIDGHAIRKGALDGPQRLAVMEAASSLSESGNMFIDDTAGRSVAEIRSICRRIKRKHGLGVIVIDYLQLIEPEDKRAMREVQVATISRRLKALAKDMNVPVICLSQLNRGVETRDDKRPRLADLRESGAIEQDADIVMFLHRPDAYNPEDRPGLAELIVAKHRSGPVGIVNLTWKKETMRFVDGEPDSPAPVDFEN